jgi:replicative DNA helicase
MKDQIGKLPPQELELEEAILGALMLEKDAINEVIDILRPDSFYSDAHSMIFSAIVELFSKNEPIDLLTVTNRLRKNGELEKAGGSFRITEITSSVSSSANIQYHARIISETSIKRDIIRMASNLLKNAFDSTSDALTLVDEAEKTIIEINSGYSASGKSKYVKQILPEAIKGIQIASKKPDGITGIPSGINALDKVTGGWQNSDLIMIGARSGMGKSDLAVNLVLNAAKNGFKVALYTLEMSSLQLVNRMIAVDREIERTKIRSGRLDDLDWSSLSMFSEKISNHAIVVDDPGINHISVRSSARKLKIKEKIDMVVVDYLQLIESLGKGKTTNDKVSEISRSLKLMAKELNIPVISLSQLSRDVEKRGGDKRPVLSDLRDSGSLEQDSDIVIFPYRPEYYGFQTRDDGSSTFQLMELDIAKHRNGSVETVDARYLGKFGKITDFNSHEQKEEHNIYNPSSFKNSVASDFDDPAPF